MLVKAANSDLFVKTASVGSRALFGVLRISLPSHLAFNKRLKVSNLGQGQPCVIDLSHPVKI